MSSIPLKQKKQGIVSAKDFNLILRILKENWWILLLILPVFYGIGSFYVYRLTTIYKASTEILLKTNDTYYQSNVLTDASFYSLGNYVDNVNETRVLQSYDLAAKVVDKLLDRLQVSYFIVGKVRTTEQFGATPFRVQVHTINPDMYETVFDFDIIDQNRYEITYEKAGKKQQLQGSFDKELVDLNFRITVHGEEALNSGAIESLKEIFYQFSIHSRDYLIYNIQTGLKIENPEYTNILRLELKDILPERAVLILDTLNTVYAQNRLVSKFELNDRTVEYIDRQLNEISFSLKSIEDTMQQYKQKKDIINLDWQQQDFLNKISTYDGQRSQVQLQLQAMEDLEKYIIEDKDPQFLPPTVYIVEKSGFMNQAVTELYSKQIELNKVSGMAKETNPMYKDLTNSITRTKQNLLTYISNARKATKEQVANLDREILAYINEAKMIPGKQRDMLNIQRKADVSEQLYNFLLEKKASTKIARASIVPDIKIVEAPRNAGVDSPNKDSIQRNFLSAGLLLGLLLIAIRVAFFTRIKTVEQLKEMTDLPLIGVLPLLKIGETEGLVVEQNPNSSISEAFRNLRTNLQYANVDRKAKTFLVTSFLPGEGKTFTSTNLALILAKSGKKTALLELDLHKPRIFKRFGQGEQHKGITTNITGQHSYEEIISETHIPNLYCIYAGPVPPNPSDFVLSDKLKEIIDRTKKEFDIVIIDTPPAGLLSDSIYLIQYVDSSIFVLNTKTSTKRTLQQLEGIIETNRLQHVSLVLNSVKRLEKRYYYHGYGYSYGYGYGYGLGQKKT